MSELQYLPKTFNDEFKANYYTDGIDISKMNPYKFVTNSYEGSGGYITGQFIFPFIREMDYIERRKQSFYRNYVQGVVNSIIDPVFSEKAYRQSDNILFDEFILDCDNNDTNIQEFMKTAVRFARMHGVSFIVMDNFTSDEIPATQTQVLQERKFPYIYLKTANEVEKYKIDKFGKLEWIIFKDRHERNSKDEEVEVYRFWNDEYSVEVIEGEDDTFIEYSEKYYHNLGIVPIVDVRVDKGTDYLPFPPFYDLCKLNLAIFNQDSEQRNLERQQAFSLLVIPGDDVNANIEIGANSVLVVNPLTSVTPTFISPDANILQVLQKSSKENVDSLLGMADVLGASSVEKNSSESGVSKSYTFLGQSHSLKTTARMATISEKKLSYLFGLYISTVIDYVVKYEDNFKPTLNEIKGTYELIERMLDLNISDTFNNKLYEDVIKIASNIFQYDDDDTELLIQDLKSSQSMI